METFELIPTVNMIQAKKIRDDRNIQFPTNNYIGNFSIPENWRTPAFEEVVSFLKHHPIYGALVRSPPYMYPRHCCEWWYTATVSEDNSVLSGTINNGNTRINISVSTLRESLGIPNSAPYSPPVSRKEARALLPQMGHSNTKGVVKRINMQNRWAYIMSTLNKCITAKSGSYDQANDIVIQIMHSMVTGNNLDYVELIFNEWVTCVKKSPREVNVPYTRFLSLMISNNLLEDDYEALGAPEDRKFCTKIDSKIFYYVIANDEIPLSAPMLIWINQQTIDFGDESTENEVDDDEEVEGPIEEEEINSSSTTPVSGSYHSETDQSSSIPNDQGVESKNELIESSSNDNSSHESGTMKSFTSKPDQTSQDHNSSMHLEPSNSFQSQPEKNPTVDFNQPTEKDIITDSPSLQKCKSVPILTSDVQQTVDPLHMLAHVADVSSIKNAMRNPSGVEINETNFEKQTKNPPFTSTTTVPQKHFSTSISDVGPSDGLSNLIRNLETKIDSKFEHLQKEISIVTCELTSVRSSQESFKSTFEKDFQEMKEQNKTLINQVNFLIDALKNCKPSPSTVEDDKVEARNDDEDDKEDFVDTSIDDEIEIPQHDTEMTELNEDVLRMSTDKEIKENFLERISSSEDDDTSYIVYKRKSTNQAGISKRRKIVVDSDTETEEDIAQKAIEIIEQQEAKDAGITVSELRRRKIKELRMIKENAKKKIIHDMKEKKRKQFLDVDFSNTCCTRMLIDDIEDVTITKEKNEGRIQINITYVRQGQVILNVNDLINLSFVDWTNMGFHVMLSEPKTVEVQIVRDELVTLAEVAFESGNVPIQLYNDFCIMMRVMLDKNRAAIKVDPNWELNYSVPEGVVFEENKYIKEPHEGFCYKDNEGNQCFLRKSSLHNTSFYLLMFVKWLCTSKQSSPFRKLISRCLHFHKSQISNYIQMAHVKEEFEDEFVMDQQIEKRKNEVKEC